MKRLLWSAAFGLYGRLTPWVLVPPVSRLLATALRPVGIRREVATRNLALALPETEDNHRRIEREAFTNLVRVYLELPYLANRSRERIGSLLNVENIDLLSRPEIAERGGLLLSGHVGNWELLAISASIQSNRPFMIPVRDQEDFGYLQRMRERFGNVVTGTDREGAFRSVQHLARGGILAMLADQSPSEDDPIVPFFGIPTRFHAGPARMALRFRPLVVVGFTERQSDGTYSTHLEELIYSDLEDTVEGRIEFTRRYAAKLEEAVRRDIPSWVWHHRRWKHSQGVSYG